LPSPAAIDQGSFPGLSGHSAVGTLGGCRRHWDIPSRGAALGFEDPAVASAVFIAIGVAPTLFGKRRNPPVFN
jgi:hypothetical protein